MRPEPAAPLLANMSAPPRSIVTLPRLQATAGLAKQPPEVFDDRPALVREVPVGPGGGNLLSNALCLARVDLPKALCAHLGLAFSAMRSMAGLGLARALVAIACQSNTTRSPGGSTAAARLAKRRVAALSEAELVDELTDRLQAIDWPAWLPPVAFAMPIGRDIADGVARSRSADPPGGIACPLLAARVATAIRGPVFMRDAAPALSNLLNLWGGATPSGIWEIWLPVPPGTVRPLWHDASTNDKNP